MNKQQKQYVAFLESVCNKFNCPDMAGALKEGFKAYIEAISDIEKPVYLYGGDTGITRADLHAINKDLPEKAKIDLAPQYKFNHPDTFNMYSPEVRHILRAMSREFSPEVVELMLSRVPDITCDDLEVIRILTGADEKWTNHKHRLIDCARLYQKYRKPLLKILSTGNTELLRATCEKLNKYDD